MTKVQRQWDILPKEKRKVLSERLITFFKQKLDQEIGLIAAGEVIDFFLENAAAKIYNKGLIDAKETFKHRLEDLEFDIDLLMHK